MKEQYIYISKHEDMIKMGGRCAFIYGAKYTAQCCAKYLQSCGVKVIAFLVSDRYDNPKEILGLPVLRIEEHAQENFDVVICAVSDTYRKEVFDELQRYQVNLLVELAPDIVKTFPWQKTVTEKCQIAPLAHIAPSVHIFADENSSVYIADDVIIGEHAIIVAVRGAQIRIEASVRIGEYANIWADGGGGSLSNEKKIGINSDKERKTEVGDGCSPIWNKDYTQIYFSVASSILSNAKVVAQFGGRILLGEHVCIGHRAIIEADYEGKIQVGRETSIEDDFYAATAKSEIIVGEDNMISYRVSMFTGGHEILDHTTRQQITNRHSITTCNHVWIGIGATLLSGCHIGYGSIVGAAAVVTKDFPERCSLAGNAAHLIKENIDWQRRPVSVQI